MKKRNEKYPKKKLEFYIESEEFNFKKISDKTAQDFVKRMQGIRSDAEAQYQQILSGNSIDWKNPSHVRSVATVCNEFQDFSFIRSSKSDLYQLVSIISLTNLNEMNPPSF